MTVMLDRALEYSKRGWYVFPCREKPGAPFILNKEQVIPAEKTPYTANGLLDATLDETQIRAWWSKWLDAMIGINAGKSGLFVIDIDRKNVNGLDTFSTWNINDSAGLHSLTPSKGMHIIFTGTGKSSTNSKTGVDTRGEGGYFIAPPSKILEGKNTGIYEDFDDWSRTPGVIPDGLMSNLFPKDTVEYVRGNTTNSPLENKKQLSKATLNFLANGAPPGERNSTLFRVSADFAGCGYSIENAREIVTPMCTRIGLNSGEVEQVLVHAYSKPRTSSIPDDIQEKILAGGKDIASKITVGEQDVIETVLLSCLLTDNSLISVVNDVLNFDDFQAFKNRLIYKAINRLHNTGMKVDYYTLSNEVAKESDKIKLDEISRTIREYVNTDNVVTYAYIIKEKASIRRIESVMDNKEQYIKCGNLIEIVSNLEKDISDIALYGGAKSTNVLTGKQATDMVIEQTRKLVSGEIQQLKTGFSVYDNIIGGIYSNELIVCAGRSGDGKSALALSLINHVGITCNKAVAMFTLEMSTKETICRLICQLTGIPFNSVYQGKFTAQQEKDYKEAVEKINSNKLYFDEGFGMTVPEIRSKIRKLMDKDIKLIVIDQLEQVKGYDNIPTYLQFDKNAYDIKNLTKEFEVPIILNHQLNRGITDRKLKNPEPILSDLNQAGEKPADQVWVIRHKMDENDSEKIVQSKIKMLKNRNGPKIEFGVIFVGERMLFSNPSREEDKIAFQNSFDDIEDDGSEPSWTN